MRDPAMQKIDPLRWGGGAIFSILGGDADEQERRAAVGHWPVLGQRRLCPPWYPDDDSPQVDRWLQLPAFAVVEESQAACFHPVIASVRRQGRADLSRPSAAAGSTGL